VDRLASENDSARLLNPSRAEREEGGPSPRGIINCCFYWPSGVKSIPRGEP
jgi:hypothetical protein